MKSLVSCFMACRRLSSKSGKASMLGAMFFKLRRNNHCSAKLSTNAAARGSASMRRTCCSSTAGSFSFPCAASDQQRLVRNAAPQEERQARSQRQIAELVHRVRPSRLAWIFLEAEQELGTRENQLQCGFDPGVESSSLYCACAGRSSAAIPYRAPAAGGDRHAAPTPQGSGVRTAVPRPNSPGGTRKLAPAKECCPTPPGLVRAVDE